MEYLRLIVVTFVEQYYVKLKPRELKVVTTGDNELVKKL